MMARYDLRGSLGYQLTLLARRVERGFEDRLEPLGLTRLHWCILLCVGQEEITQPSDIAEFVGVDRAVVSRALKVLEKKNWIARDTAALDRRGREVQLCPGGHDVLLHATEAARANAAAFTQHLSGPARAELIAQLIALNANPAEPLKGL